MGITTTSVFASRRRGLTLVALAMLGTPIALFATLRAFPHLDQTFMSANFHLVIACSIAACAIGIALIAGLAAGRSRDYALIFLAIGCLAVGILMLGHGLVTPGVAGVQPNLWVTRFPNLAITVFAVSQLVAVMRPRPGLERAVVRHPWLSMAIPTVLLVGGLVLVVSATRQAPPAVSPSSGYGATEAPEYGAAEADKYAEADQYGASYGGHESHGAYGAEEDQGYGAAGAAPAAPAPQGGPGTEKILMDALALFSAVLLVGVGSVYWRRWRLSNDGLVFALALACWLAVEALFSLRFGTLWRISWWDYHGLLVLGFGSTVFAIVAGYLRTKESSNLSGAFLHDSLDHIARGYPEALKTLVAAVEARDEYTSGHSRRVTETAAAIGQRLGLQHDDLRRLVWGAELHDIGKIGISDHIIHKPGALTAEERDLVKEHPVIGWEIARQARSLNEVLEVIRHHHERFDGAGYPDRLAGEEIPLAARIVAIADVWDALTSDRAYRPAWDTSLALEIMREGRGTQFDAKCLGAFFEYAEAEGFGKDEAPTPTPASPTAGFNQPTASISHGANVG